MGMNKTIVSFGVTAKLLLDIGVLVAVICQLQPLEDFQDSLNLENICQPAQAVCLSNVRDLLRFSRSAYWADIAGLSCIVIAMITDLILLPLIAFTTDVEDTCTIVTGVISGACNACAFWGVLACNAYLWNGLLQYISQVPESIVLSLQHAATSGIAPLVLGFVIGCPACVLLLVLAVIADK
jgi:hypothetical protein